MKGDQVMQEALVPLTICLTLQLFTLYMIYHRLGEIEYYVYEIKELLKHKVIE